MYFLQSRLMPDFARKAIAWLVLACLFPSIVPIPLPTSLIARISKDKSQPFPCQNCACGCSTAEQCWRNCCCYTPAQRLAWAKKHNVTPPDYFNQSLALSDSEASDQDKIDEPSGSECCKKTTSACCTRKAIQTCCKKQSSIVERSEETKKTTSRKVGFILVIQALKCHGHSTEYSMLHAALLPPKVDSPLGILPLVSEACIRLASFVSISLIVDTPPPRSCVA